MCVSANNAPPPDARLFKSAGLIASTSRAGHYGSILRSSLGPPSLSSLLLRTEEARASKGAPYPVAILDRPGGDIEHALRPLGHRFLPFSRRPPARRASRSVKFWLIPRRRTADVFGYLVGRWAPPEDR